MPFISGDLQLVTAKSATVTHVLVHAPTPRPSGAKVIVPESDTISVSGGKFTANIDVGEAVIVPVHSGIPGTPIPVVVRSETRNLAEAMQNAMVLTPEERDRVSEMYAEVVAALHEARQAATRATSQAAAAAQSAAQAASATPPATSDMQGKLKLSGDLTGTADAPKVVTAGDSRYILDAGQQRSAFVRTNTDGQIWINTTAVTKMNHAVNKGYVDGGFAAKNHNHGIAQVEGLTAILDGKAAKSHTHTLANITDAPNSHASAATPSTLVSRDTSGRTEVAAPSTANHVANKSYVDTAITSAMAVGGPYQLSSGQITAYKIGRLVFVIAQAATTGSKGTLPSEYRPVRNVDFFLTVPNQRAYPGWCNILTSGAVSINFSKAESTDGYGSAVYISAS